VKEPGIPFGEYRLIRRLGKGGMAEVFLSKRVRAQGFEKLLVVKRLLPHLCRDQRAAAMFLKEARIAALIDHPNLAHVSDFGEIQGSYYLAMEYVQGESLQELLEAQGGKLPVPIAVRIAIEVLEALQAIHSARSAEGEPLHLVHRDVSPRNVMIRPDGVVKLLDLGIVASRDGTSVRAMGTRGFMSPEQERGGKVDARSDLYAVGLLLRRMLGEVPKSELPIGLAEILDRALAEDVEGRPRTAVALRGELEAFLAPFGMESSRSHLGVLIDKTGARSLVRRSVSKITRMTRMTDPKRRVQAGIVRLLLFGVVAGLIVGFAWTFFRGPDSLWRSARPRDPAAAADEAEKIVVVETSSGAEASAPSETDQPDEPEERTPVQAARARRAAKGRRETTGQPGFLTIDTDPWTEVLLNGKKLGITPLVSLRLPSGAHELDLRNPEFGLRKKVRVLIHPGGTTRLHRTFRAEE
jgi:hypothetical protein